jgi:hypothetical protein
MDYTLAAEDLASCDKLPEARRDELQQDVDALLSGVQGLADLPSDARETALGTFDAKCQIDATAVRRDALEAGC